MRKHIIVDTICGSMFCSFKTTNMSNIAVLKQHFSLFKLSNIAN